MPKNTSVLAKTMHTHRLISTASTIWKQILLSKRFDRIGIALILSLPVDIILGWLADPIFVYGLYISSQLEAQRLHALSTLAAKVDYGFLVAYGALSALSISLTIGGAWYYIFFVVSKRAPAFVAVGAALAVYLITIIWGAPVSLITGCTILALPLSVQYFAVQNVDFALSFVKILTTGLGVSFFALGAFFQFRLYRMLRRRGEEALEDGAIARLIDEPWQMASPWKLTLKAVPLTIRRPNLDFKTNIDAETALAQGKKIRLAGASRLNSPGFAEKLVLKAYGFFGKTPDETRGVHGPHPDDKNATLSPASNNKLRSAGALNPALGTNANQERARTKVSSNASPHRRAKKHPNKRNKRNKRKRR